MSLASRLWYATPRAIRVVITLAVSLLIWEVLVYALKIKPFLLASPSQVARVLVENPGYILGHSWHTLYETLIGFVLAVAFGIAISIAIVSSRFLEETLYVLLVTLNSIPKVAIAPLFVVWLGSGIQPKIAIAAMIAVFVIVIDTVLGLRSIDPDMVDLARSMKASKFQTLLRIRFPNALPHLFAGMKVGITMALIGAIVGEFVASDRGLGFVILTAQGQFDTPTMFAAVVVLSVMGTALFFLIDLAERVALPWHVSRRNEAAIEQQLSYHP